MSRAERSGSGLAVGPLGVDVDQAHLHGAHVLGELAVTAVALVAQPGVLRAPEDLLRLPDVGSPEGEAEGLEPHRLEGAVAGEDDQVGPGDLLAVLLLDRPEQSAGLVEVGVVGPAVEGREPLGAAAAAAPAVGDAVGARRVPRHPDEEGPVVAVVGRPPVLRGRHDLHHVPLERVDVEGREVVGVAVAGAHRGGQGRVGVEDLEVQLVRPPVPVRPRSGRLDRRGVDRRVLALAPALGHAVTGAVGHVGPPLSSHSFDGTWFTSRALVPWALGALRREGCRRTSAPPAAELRTRPNPNGDAGASSPRARLRTRPSVSRWTSC
jgi:hypothetical protein